MIGTSCWLTIHAGVTHRSPEIVSGMEPILSWMTFELRFRIFSRISCGTDVEEWRAIWTRRYVATLSFGASRAYRLRLLAALEMNSLQLVWSTFAFSIYFISVRRVSSSYCNVVMLNESFSNFTNRQLHLRIALKNCEVNFTIHVIINHVIDQSQNHVS